MVSIKHPSTVFFSYILRNLFIAQTTIYHFILPLTTYHGVLLLEKKERGWFKQKISTSKSSSSFVLNNHPAPSSSYIWLQLPYLIVSPICLISINPTFRILPPYPLIHPTQRQLKYFVPPPHPFSFLWFGFSFFFALCLLNRHPLTPIPNTPLKICVVQKGTGLKNLISHLRVKSYVSEKDWLQSTTCSDKTKLA